MVESKLGAPARWRLAGPAGARVLLALILLLGGLLYLYDNLDFFLSGDEGTYAYAAWRTSLGEAPYRDFLSSEMPVFLYWGGLVVRLFGRSFVPLRVATMLAIALSAYLLYATNRELAGRPVAVLSAALFLAAPSVFRYGRFFRAEAYMVLFEVAGFYALVLGRKRRHLSYVVLAGAFFGLSILSKLFGLLPLAGCLAYQAYACWRERRPLKDTLKEGLALALPALALVGATALIFSRVAPYFYSAVFQHHTMVGAGMPLAQRADKALAFYRNYVGWQRLPIVLAALGACVVLGRRRPLVSLFAWQIPTALAFLVLSRSLGQRYLFYLAPTVATLMAVALAQLAGAHRLIPSVRGPWRSVTRAVFLGIALALAAAAVRPWMHRNARDVRLEEHDSSRFTALIQALTGPEELVMADHPGLCFLAGRRSTFWAAEMSGAGARSGQIRGAALIDELERQDVALVIIGVSGGGGQMTAMIDYPSFRRYVQSHYALVDRFEYTYTLKGFEIYSRVDSMPIRPDLHYREEIALQGARLSDAVISSGASLTVETRWQALQEMPRDYYASALLVDANGRQWAETHGQLQIVDGSPTSRWSAGEMGLATFRLRLSARLPAGDYYLVVQAYCQGSGFVLPEGQAAGPVAGGVPAVATVKVTPAAEQPAEVPVSAIRYPLAGISFGDHYDLLGYDLSTTEMAAGETVQVTLYWGYRQPSTIDYKVFVHLLDGASQVQGQHDAVPEGGGEMTSGWVQEDVLVDRFEPALQPTAPRGTLQIEVGFYDLATGARLPLLRDGKPAGEDRLILPTTISVR